MQVSEKADSQDEEATDNLGQKLRRAREAQGLSLDAVAAELRIGAHHLDALEACRFEALDAPVFAKGYLKQYAARLGLDVAALADEFDRSVGASVIDIAPSTTLRVRDYRQIRIWVAAGLGLTLVAALLGTWWWLGTDSLPESSVDVLAPSPEIPPVEPFGADSADPDLATPEPEIRAAGTRQPEVPTPEAEVAAPEREVAAPEPALAESSPSEQAELAADAPGLSDVGDALASESVAGGSVLEIRFNDDSWAEITNSSGQRLYYDLGRGGTSTRLAFAGPLNLFFGNASGIELTLDGEPVPIPESAIRGDLAEFELGPDGNASP